MKAFPWSIDNGESVRGEKGMDLRDYFAAVALSVSCGCSNPENAAKEAYEYADAMMKERDRVDDSHEIMAAAIMKKKGQG